MHSIAFLLPALSLLASAQAWSFFSSSDEVAAPLNKRVNPDLGIQSFYGNVGSGYATYVGCDGLGNYVSGSYSSPISWGLYPSLQASCDDQTAACNAGALKTIAYTLVDCLAQSTACRNNQYLAVTSYGTTTVCPMLPVFAAALPAISIASMALQAAQSVASVASVAAHNVEFVASRAAVCVQLTAQIAAASVESVAAVAAESVASEVRVGPLRVQSLASVLSVGTVSQASRISVLATRTANDPAYSVESVYSVSTAMAASASAAAVAVYSAASVSSVYQAALNALDCNADEAHMSAYSVASTSSVQAAAAAQSQASLASISSIGVQVALSIASTASVQTAAAAQSQSAIVSQVAQSSVAAVSRASLSALSVSSTSSAAAAAAASTQASLSSVSAVAAQSLLSVASTASAQVAAASQSQAALASQSSFAIQSLSSLQSQAAAASQSLLAIASQSNLAVNSALSVASVASAQAASVSQSAQSTLSIASIASVSRISVSAAAASASAAAAALVLPAGYKAASTQLIIEGANGARALAGASTSSDSMTPSVCALYCTKAGFAISGTEYGSECYCSNSLDNGASLTSIATSSAYPCSGAATQVCGGFSALSVAYNTALATLTNNVFTLITVPVALPTGVSPASSSLIAEGPNGRALTGPSTDLPSMTPTVCANFCTAAGYAISGTECSTQCFCGNALSNGASLSLVSSASTMTCGGAAAQTCGGMSAMSVAYNTALASLSNGVFTLLKAATVTLPSGYKSASASLIGEGPNGRALTGAATSSSKMTPTVCAQYCTAASFAISGTEYSYCGNSFSNGASLSLTSGNTPMPCSGDATQLCGAGSAMSVVYNTALATLTNGVLTLTTSPTIPTIILPSGYKSASSSLIAEGPSGRAFAGAATSSSTMTPIVCAQYCTAAGFAISATEYSSECYCGNSFSNGGALSLTSSISPMACSGDASQTCGAPSAMSVVYNTALATLTNGVFTLIASTTTPTTATIILPGGYKSATSSLVAEGTSGRSLSGASRSSSDMTPSVCAVYCTKAGYAISGTEWYTECYCGNSLSNGASLSLISTSSKTACGGDATQTCGGASALSIVYNTGLASLSNGVLTLTTQAALPTGWAVNTLGSGSCVAEPSSGRALSSASYEAADMTIEGCLAFCEKGKYPFAGLEYSTQCFCGTSNPATASSTGCNMPCGGASSETCGGPNAVSVYYSSSNLAAVPAPVATTAVTLTNGFTSTLNCWSEADGRLMKGAGFTSDVMTYDLCTNYCSGAGFTQAGVEWGRECYCSSTVDLTKLVKNDNCDVACSGASSKICGGPQALQIFTTTAAADPTITLPNGWATDQSCLAEISARLLNAASMSDPAMTPTMCTNFCASKGATQAGVEYGTEVTSTRRRSQADSLPLHYQCYCGTGVNLKTAARATNCDMACAGDQTTECGGSNALNVYTKASTVARRRFRHRS